MKNISFMKHVLGRGVYVKKLVPCGTDGRLLLSGFQAVVTLTLTLDRVIRHTVVHQSSTSMQTPSFAIGYRSGRGNMHPYSASYFISKKIIVC